MKIQLFILPIRNGNGGEPDEFIHDVLTFYPTYKEWKRLNLIDILYHAA